MRQDAADVQAGAIRVARQPRCHQVHREADNRDEGDHAAAHRGRVDQSAHALDGEPGGEQQQGDAVRLPGQGIDAGKAVGVRAARRPIGQPGRNNCHEQGGRVREHVAGVGHQGE